MIYLAYIIGFFSLAQFIVAIFNTLNHNILNPSDKLNNVKISILIPARNEEETIGHLLNDLLIQAHQNIEILVYNDESTDNTAELVDKFARRDRRIKLINSTALPDGWYGKNHGCNVLSQHANGEYLLFLDADVRIYEDILIRTLTYAKRQKLSLLSLFPSQNMLSLGERIVVPNMNFILLSLLPLTLVLKSGFSSLAAANGQFMLFRASDYRQTMPHNKLKQSMVEDIEIARLYKQNNLRVACLPGNTNVACRMYKGYSEALNGFSKNISGFFGNSLLLAFTFWLITSFGFLIMWYAAPGVFFNLYVLFLSATIIAVSYTSRQNPWLNLLLYFPKQLALIHVIVVAAINKYRNQFEWKGRYVS